MCGICGYVGDRPIDKNTLKKMNDSMYHRGPNDSGVSVFTVGGSGYIGLGHRRLSIIDTSCSGRQPMWSDDGKYAIVFNGEIYNFQSIRSELESRGYTFRSKSDTEVLLKAYVEYGPELLKQLNGMYAFCIYDGIKDICVLARDKMGKKPLYYYHKDGVFLFGSELKPLMLYPEYKRDIRRDIIGTYLVYGMIPAPDTIFRDTYKLCPGEYLIYDYKNNTIKKDKYFDFISLFNETEKDDLITDYSAAKKELKNLLYDSIEKRLVSDVPVGAFLSGGIDSTLVCAIANEVKPGGIDTYSIGFEDSKYDESRFAKESAAHIGTRHHEKIMTISDMKEMLEGLPTFYDEPFADASQLPTMLVSGFAADDVTVVLSGDGGDELFCGYISYDENLMLQVADPFLNIFRALIPEKSVDSIIKDYRVNALMKSRDANHKTQILGFIRKELAKSLLKEPQKEPLFDESVIHSGSFQKRRMIFDTVQYMPEDILMKVDRASMRFSLESRCPILDHRIAELSLRMPQSFKYKGCDKKHILKDILYDFVPKSMMDRPKKGFSAPVLKWLREDLNEDLSRYADKHYLIEQGIFDYDGIHSLINKVKNSDKYVFYSMLWSFYIFQKWYDEFVYTKDI